MACVGRTLSPSRRRVVDACLEENVHRSALASSGIAGDRSVPRASERRSATTVGAARHANSPRPMSASDLFRRGQSRSSRVVNAVARRATYEPAPSRCEPLRAESKFSTIAGNVATLSITKSATNTNPNVMISTHAMTRILAMKRRPLSFSHHCGPAFGDSVASSA